MKGSAEMKHLLASLTIGACLLLPSAGVVLGAAKGVGCGVSPGATMTPGNAARSPGSPFNEPNSQFPGSPGGTGGQNYAGNGPNSVAHANSTAAVSQYDVACLNVTPP